MAFIKQVSLLFLLTGCISGLFSAIPEEEGTIEVFFCDKVDCLEVFKSRVISTDSISCALYHADSKFMNALKDKNVRFVFDEDHAFEKGIVESGSGLMHNKFCVWDDFVWTGSWNPSQGMSIANNVILIQSKTLANAYLKEFDELYSGTFHKGKSSPGIVKLNGNIVEAYFCPEDNCKEQVLRMLKSAKSSVHFMTFSFTDDDIGNLLIDKMSYGIEVKGVFDPRKDKYSEFEKLSSFSKISKLHHKVFIIDNHTVITGSYNPSKNANERNDENIVIIRDESVAQLFEEEFSLFD